MHSGNGSGSDPVVSGWRETLVGVVDIDRWVQTYAEVGGWGGVSDPIEYDFGPCTVREWVACGPCGVRLDFFQRT